MALPLGPIAAFVGKLVKSHILWTVAPKMAKRMYRYYTEENPEKVVGFVQKLHDKYPDKFMLSSISPAAATAIKKGLDHVDSEVVNEVISGFDYNIITSNKSDLFEIDLFYDGNQIFEKHITKSELRSAIKGVKSVR